MSDELMNQLEFLESLGDGAEQVVPDNPAEPDLRAHVCANTVIGATGPEGGGRALGGSAKPRAPSSSTSTPALASSTPSPTQEPAEAAAAPDIGAPTARAIRRLARRVAMMRSEHSNAGRGS